MRRKASPRVRPRAGAAAECLLWAAQLRGSALGGGAERKDRGGLARRVEHPLTVVGGARCSGAQKYPFVSFESCLIRPVAINYNLRPLRVLGPARAVG